MAPEARQTIRTVVRGAIEQLAAREVNHHRWLVLKQLVEKVAALVPPMIFPRSPSILRNIAHPPPLNRS
jgi:hypothetical protein